MSQLPNVPMSQTFVHLSFAHLSFTHWAHWFIGSLVH